MRYFICLMGLICWAICDCCCQNSVKGLVLDELDGEPLVGATVVLKGTTTGTITEWDGSYVIKSEFDYPVTLEISYIGYATKEIEVPDDQEMKIELGTDAEIIETVEIKGRRISEKQRESPLTVESLDIVAIKETPAANFYDGLGSLKDVDLTAASLGFKIVNTRGFNSTSPVRSLQLIDGVDNQSPGLNFSLGNFLGASDLDVNKVDLVVGASSAFYGPGAFNGVISLTSKDPFFNKGFSIMTKIGERNLIEGAIRWADVISNKNGDDLIAFKLNAFGMRANDWEATDYGPIPGSISDASSPGGFDAVNIYGDEFQIGNDARNNGLANPGLGVFYRSGYREIDLVDYDAENLKLSGAVHIRLQPDRTYESPEVILASNYGGGTTVYQGDNRFSLKNIQFFQHRIELKKKDKYFLRAYLTHEDAGDSYDPYFTAIKLQQRAKSNSVFKVDYTNYWSRFNPRIKAMEGFPDFRDFRGDVPGFNLALNTFLGTIQDSLVNYHAEALEFANSENTFADASARFEPGTQRFQDAFDDITGRIANSEGGTRFYDKSKLYHVHGEYIFEDLVSGGFAEDMDIRVGANYRGYLPDSKGSILLDTNGRDLTTYEYGVYTGLSISTLSNKLRINASGRMDKHENFDYLFSPAVSFVYSPKTDNYLRLNFSSGVRNPTLTEQYLNYNVGPAILIGNINGVKDLLTVDSYIDFLNSANTDTLRFFDVAPLQPEKVRTVEVGYRTILSDKLYLDAGYYYSWYQDFIGFQLGVDATFDPIIGAPITQRIFRVSANSLESVTTQGFSIGMTYYFMDKLSVVGNYSYNNLNTETDDPIVPAYNTPKHKYNIGINGRDINVFGPILFSFNFNYKWQDEFVFEGSPQFTGVIPSYGLLDGQVNWKHPDLNVTLKIGAANLLNNQVIQAFGGPVIGRFAYASILYDFVKK